MRITVIKKTDGKVKTAIIGGCPWLVNDPVLPVR
jgi:hypothetical protein